MMDESKIIIQTMHELNGSALEQQYSLMREHLTSEAGQLTVGAAFAAEREQYLIEEEAAERQQKFEASVKEHQIQNVKFIASTVDILPSGAFGEGPKLTFPNNPKSYLPALGTLDRTIFVPRSHYDQGYKKSDAYYVVGANVKKGLLLCAGSEDDGRGYLLLAQGRQARKAARHFSRIPGDLNQQTLSNLYDPEFDHLKITEENGHVLRSPSYERKIISQIDDATMYDFNVPTHLLHLTALFNVRSEWKYEVLDEYTKGISSEQVAELKSVVAVHLLQHETREK